MKKKVVIALLIILTLLPAYTYAGVEYVKAWKSGAQVYFDGQLYDGEQSPINYANRLQFPLRELVNRMGGTIEIKDGGIYVVSDPVNVVAQNAESCVLIVGYDSANRNNLRRVNQGSGVILPGGYIVTCYHVIDQSPMIGIQYDGMAADKFYFVTEFPYIDKVNDIAIFKAPGDLPEPLKIGDSDKVAVGDKVVAISSPHGVKNVITEGKVSSISITSGVPNIQYSAQACPGSSGGALFNIDGELIGILESTSGAVPINEVMKLIK